MVRFTVEFELPNDEEERFRTAMHDYSQVWTHWKVLGIHKSTDPPCPVCGSTMEWDREFAGYVCHHPA